jgi:hypothetical protein
MSKVEFHCRKFDDTQQETLRKDFELLGVVWYGFEEHQIISREIDMGLAATKKLLPDSLHEFIRHGINPFTYTITLYLDVGVPEDEKYCHCSECT